MNRSTSLPDVTQWLTYFPEHMNPDEHLGLWICRDILDVDYVKYNIACISADKWDDLRHCREFFEAFKRIFVAIPEPVLRDLTAKRIGEYAVGAVVLKASPTAFDGCFTLREYCEKHGRDRLERVALDFEELENPRLLNYAAIERPERKPTVISGIKALDRGIGELSPEHLRDWHYLQAAGSHNISERCYADTGKSFWYVSPKTEALINEWWDRRIFCFDTRQSGAHDEETIFSLFEYAWYRHGATVFVLDNLMTARIGDARDYYRAQTRFVTRLTEFAKRREVLIHLIAHPRKTGKDEVSADDVAGIADITNLADNVFRVDRLPEGNDSGADARIKILKNREYGKRGDIPLLFDEQSRRFSDMDKSGFERRYSWEPQVFEELPDDTPTPF